METEYLKRLAVKEWIILPYLYETAFGAYSHLTLQSSTKTSPWA